MVPRMLWSRSIIFFMTTYSMNTDIIMKMAGRIVPVEVSSPNSPLTMEKLAWSSCFTRDLSPQGESSETSCLLTSS